jgi:hypothetical protein
MSFEMSWSTGRFRVDKIVWALVHANTPGGVDESAHELRDRVGRMRCSAGSADAMEYWGGRLLELHEIPAPALDGCALDEWLLPCQADRSVVMRLSKPFL